MQNYKKMKSIFFNYVKQVLITSLGKSSAQNAHNVHADRKTSKHKHTHTHKEILLTFMSISQTNKLWRLSIGNYLG